MADTSIPIWRTTLGRRLPVAAALLALWSVGIEARLVYWQIIEHSELVKAAEIQQLSTVVIPASRGEIRDRAGRPLAVTADALAITSEPIKITDPDEAITSICAVLADCTAAERVRFVKAVAAGKKFLYVRRLVDQDRADRVAALHIKGIGFVPEPRRFHTNGDLAAHLLGYVNRFHKPLSGLELAYNSLIEGKEGKAIISTDASKKRTLNRRIEKAPTAGASLELTIDTFIQHVAERELRLGVEENRAPSGSAIVMDPWTGEILALANVPTFDPDAIGGLSSEQLRNSAVEDLYEPGSTFKIVTASAALEQHVVTPDEILDVEGGSIKFGDDIVRDTHNYHSLSFTDVIVKSSNVGAIKVGLRLGAERLTQYVKRFGFGRRAAQRDFPSESAGMVTDAQHLSQRELARVSMGYLVGVTPLQMAVAVSSIANGGELLRPRVVRRIIGHDGIQNVPREVLNRTVPPEVASELTRIMEGVVERGTATSAQIAGFSIAGKTGTAARLVNKHYSKTEYNASFVGFIPSRKPVYTIVVVINSPHGKNGYYGGSVAAPIFRRISEQLLQYGGVPVTFNPPPAVIVDRSPVGGREIPASTRAPAPVITVPASDDGRVPNLAGLNARDAMRTVARLGMVSELRGATGFVVDQRPVAGTRLVPGLKATLWLGREFPAAHKADTGTQ